MPLILESAYVVSIDKPSRGDTDYANCLDLIMFNLKLFIMETPLSPSPSRTYVIPVHADNFTKLYFKQFTLPEDEENTCAHATWYFYNRLDFFSCGRSAYPIEMHNNIKLSQS